MLILIQLIFKGVTDTLKANSKLISVDQPKGDVLNQSKQVLFCIFH